MVGTSPIQLEWEKLDLPTVHNDYDFSCLTPKVGSSLQQGMDQRFMVSSKANPPYQLLEIAGSLTSGENFCQRVIRDNKDYTTTVAYINRMGGQHHQHYRS